MGKVLRIVVFKRGAIVQTMVEFEDVQTATTAKAQLHGCDIYSGSCTLKVEFAKTDRLNVKKNDEMTWDFTDEFTRGGMYGGGAGGAAGAGAARDNRPVLLQEPPPQGSAGPSHGMGGSMRGHNPWGEAGMGGYSGGQGR